MYDEGKSRVLSTCARRGTQHVVGHRGKLRLTNKTLGRTKSRIDIEKVTMIETSSFATKATGMMRGRRRTPPRRGVHTSVTKERESNCGRKPIAARTKGSWKQSVRQEMVSRSDVQHVARGQCTNFVLGAQGGGNCLAEQQREAGQRDEASGTAEQRGEVSDHEQSAENQRGEAWQRTAEMPTGQITPFSGEVKRIQNGAQ